MSSAPEIAAASDYLRSRRLFVITVMLESAIAPAAIIGLKTPKIASGIILAKVEDLVDNMLLLRLLDSEANVHDIVEVALEDVRGVSPFNTKFTKSVQRKEHSAVHMN